MRSSKTTTARRNVDAMRREALAMFVQLDSRKRSAFLGVLRAVVAGQRAARTSRA